MKIIGITKGSGTYCHSRGYVTGALVELSGAELNALVGEKRDAAALNVGDKLDVCKQIESFHQLRCQFNELGKTAKHLRSVADKMEEFPLPKWSKS